MTDCKYRLRQGTAKKLREQYYLMILFWAIIWVLMAILFFLDENPQAFLIYIATSVILLPYLLFKKAKPYFQTLNSNLENVYLEIRDNQIIFNHFQNLKKFDREKIKFDIAGIVNIKKAFRKDDTVNKITLIFRDNNKIMLEDFENAEDLLEKLLSKSNSIHG